MVYITSWLCLTLNRGDNCDSSGG